MQKLSKINILLTLILTFTIGSLFGLSVNLGWGLPLGTSLTLIVAALGFGVALYQSYATRKHNRLLVKPHLLIKTPISSIHLDGYYTFTLMVKNSGLGPALIEKFSISIGDDGDIANGTLLDIIRQHSRDHFNAKGKVRCLAGFLLEGDVIDKGEEKIIVQINISREGVHPTQVRRLATNYSSSIIVNIDYHCHYGKKFKLEKLALQNQKPKTSLITTTPTN